MMNDLLIHPGPGRANLPVSAANPAGGAFGASPSAAPLLEVLWRRRWTVALTLVVCAAGAAAYLAVAPRVYRSTASLVVGDTGPSPRTDDRAPAPRPENYIETQRDVVQSYEVLSRALDSVGFRSLKTFAKVDGDAAAWLRAGNGFDVDVANKADVVTVTMESRYPREAADLVNAVVRAYVADRQDHRKADGEEVVRVLRKQRAEMQAKWDETLKSMLQEQRAPGGQGVLSARGGGSIVQERASALSAALTAAQIASVELRARRDAVKAALADPATAAAFVDALQANEHEINDREYDELRSQLFQQVVALRTAEAGMGRDHPGLRVQVARVESLRQRIAEKQREMAQSYLLSVTTQLAAAEGREQQLKQAVATQQAQVQEAGAGAVKYATLEAEAERLRRECEALDRRVAEVSASSIESKQSDVQVLEWARPGVSPVKPRASLTLLASLAAGAVLAVGAAMLREARDSRVRSPEEAVGLLGVPALGVIPRMDAHLSPVARGLMSHLQPLSQTAEAYRSIRLSLGVGAGRGARTLLVTSPSPGEGKSTTAGNLAISLAQAGHRTLLLDCDLRSPVQHYLFDPDGTSDAAEGAGLTSVLEGRVKLRGAVVPTQVPGLYLLPCGPAPLNPSELLAGKRFEQALETLAETFERIVIDSPALSAVSDARSLAILADATLVVLRMNQSSREMGARAMDVLEGSGVLVAGIVANDVPLARREPAYPSWEGALQYAAGAAGARVWAPGAELGATAVGTDTPVRPLPRQAEVLAIEEPDWAALADAVADSGAK